MRAWVSALATGWISACTTTQSVTSHDAAQRPPSRALSDAPGALQTSGPGGSEVQHEYCRPGAAVEPNRVLVPSVEIGISFPVGGGEPEDAELLPAKPYARSSCAPN